MNIHPKNKDAVPVQFIRKAAIPQTRSPLAILAALDISTSAIASAPQLMKKMAADSDQINCPVPIPQKQS